MTDYDDNYELRSQVSYERRQERRYRGFCSECLLSGGHAIGCPEQEEKEKEIEHE